jgi:hypothetical protein
MEGKVFLPESARQIDDVWDFLVYLNRQAARWFQGNCRYGTPRRSKRYLSRLKAEIAAYESTGNAEHLFNASNYAYLESRAPENRKYHFDPTVESATRGNGF